MFGENDTFAVRKGAYDYRETGGETVLYPVDDFDGGAIVVLDDVGTVMMGMARSGLGFSSIVGACVERYGIDWDRSRADVFHFFDHLVNLGIIVVENVAR